MAKEVFMPKLGMTQETGTILQWFKAEGDLVQKGDRLLEVMTDKINIEVESYETGVLLKRYYDTDDVVAVNEVIAYIGQPGENVPDGPPSAASPEPGGASPEPAEVAYAEVQTSTSQAASGKVRATPAARATARKYGIDLLDVARGKTCVRIYRSDVEKYATDQLNKQKDAPFALPSSASKSPQTGSPASAELRADNSDRNVMKIEGVRKIIGTRMAQSAFTAPHVTLTTDVDMSEVISLRESLAADIQAETGRRLSFTEVIVKCAAHALRHHAALNAWLKGDQIIFHRDVHIGIAVSTDRGLMVPVLRDADKKGLAQLTREAKDLAIRARANQLTPDEMSGSTFTISNLGMYAVDAFTPIINPPETAILGVGRIQEKAVGVGGQVVLRPMMALSLSFDHRAADGAPAAAFLTELKSVLERPLRILV